MPPRSLEALLGGLIDYAGLFPPAAHNMDEAVARYARYRRGPQARVLGRLVVPAARLVEWERSVAALPAAELGEGPWRLTVLVSLPADADLAAVASFNHHHESRDQLDARVDTIEVKVASGEDVRSVAAALPPGVEAFYECQPAASFPALIAGIKASGGGAKLRTGGLVPGEIAAPSAVADFVAACVAAAVPFKATAGLHHPVRAEQALTYQPDSPRAVTNGFLNVFVGATLALACGLGPRALLPIIEEMSPASFVFTESELAWRDLAADLDQVRNARRLARSFGSCSFEEPMADLDALGMPV